MSGGRPGGDVVDAAGASGDGHDAVLVRGCTRSPIVQEMAEELCTGRAIASTRQPHRSQQQQHLAVQREKDGETEKKTRKKRPRDEREREEERRGERGREENGREEESVRKEGEERGSKVVEVETDWATVKRRTKQRRQQGRDEASAKSDGKGFKTIQIFVKVDGSKVFPLEVSLSDKVGDVAKRIPSSACDSKRDVCMTCEGRVIRRSNDLKNCGISDGSTVQVMSRMRGGGKHKDKTSKAAKKRNRSPEKPEQTPRQEAESQVEHDVDKLDGNRDAVSHDGRQRQSERLELSRRSGVESQEERENMFENYERILPLLAT